MSADIKTKIFEKFGLLLNIDEVASALPEGWSATASPFADGGEFRLMVSDKEILRITCEPDFGDAHGGGLRVHVPQAYASRREKILGVVGSVMDRIAADHAARRAMKEADEAAVILSSIDAAHDAFAEPV